MVIKKCDATSFLIWWNSQRVFQEGEAGANKRVYLNLNQPTDGGRSLQSIKDNLFWSNNFQEAGKWRSFYIEQWKANFKKRKIILELV